MAGYQIPPQLFKLWLYIPTNLIHVSGTCDVVQSFTYCSYILVLKVGVRTYKFASLYS